MKWSKYAKKAAVTRTSALKESSRRSMRSANLPGLRPAANRSLGRTPNAAPKSSLRVLVSVSGASSGALQLHLAACEREKRRDSRAQELELLDRDVQLGLTQRASGVHHIEARSCPVEEGDL